MSSIASAISASIDSLELLSHPYYHAWQKGELQKKDLKNYAEQYRHFESCLPDVLAAGVSQIADDDPRLLVEANLSDELSNPRPHLQMFDDFANAVGAVGQASPTAATSELVGLYEDAAEQGPVPLLAVVAAYEAQGADIAATKAAALSLHYHLDEQGVEFWTAHATAEQQHATWTVDALERLSAAPEEVALWANRSARAWWRFLDEREAARAA